MRNALIMSFNKEHPTNKAMNPDNLTTLQLACLILSIWICVAVLFGFTWYAVRSIDPVDDEEEDQKLLDEVNDYLDNKN